MSQEAVMDLLFVERHPHVCVKGLPRYKYIVDVSMENGVITFLIEDGKDEITDLACSYENPLFVKENK
jgi:hypothetical protein